MTVNTFTMNQCVLSNMKIYNIPIWVQENAVNICKKVETKWISQNTLSEMAALTLNNLIWLLKQLQSRHKLCKKHTLKNFAAKHCTNNQLLVNLYN